MSTELTQVQKDYKEWIESLNQTEDKFYYCNLLKYATQIVDDLSKYKQHYIARKLHMNGPKFSIIKSLLEAQAQINLQG